ncbi:MAG: class I SAM-dependent methyltransferase [Elusimicrobia bacterium]|nr:class I SAM-dependent methyltransferase [Elusimicrobiota bacterium]
MPHDALSASKSKAALRLFYAQAYARCAEMLSRTEPGGTAVELGAGPGLSAQFLPQLLATDITPGPGIQLVADAQRLPFADNSLGAVFMLNTLHHLPDPELALSEIQRCLKPGGRALISDQYPGFPGALVFRFLHSEPYDPSAPGWKSSAAHPMAGANGAIAHIIFVRNRDKFHTLFPRLELVSVTPHTPLLYWLSGGLKSWKLVPDALAPAAARADSALNRLLPFCASFADYELVKK